ncbi:glycine betaine ABC transporter substrate-binding protein [Pseudodesulfovibrio senegalensis]|uniref:Glycine/betaine ABC transporter substrate-binding protein n=1 Tax=Pseudodesulfovibrio senegalensis TaxID=1721087 RepID=A0A6N6N5D0_9BACT|nr:glycine betaine ABC transporter substrate-binding protein [Pseudodesulfovibrio senegalensis]KAB1442444.1 glycine/betaine ABC transporter substrate-binding protein [Pseudodesulfovibrio senegalensis]
MSDPFRRIIRAVLTIAAILVFSVPAYAGKEIRIASVGWTGVTIKTELAVSILNSLGYDAENIIVSVPIAYKAMATNEADAFMGNWMPSMASIANKYFEEGTVIKYVANMPGAQYTLAVPSYCAQQGLKDFKDIVKFGDRLDWKIYGIEAGNDGNQIIQGMIDKNMFGLGKFSIVPSSEAGMLAQVQSYAKENKWIVFLGWAPHSMNERIDMTYLTGSTAETFGANDGTATVWTNIRKGFDKENPNAAKLLKHMVFSIDMMNQIMTTLHADHTLAPRDAALAWLKKHPEVYKKWLEGVTTEDGKPAVPAFEKTL